VYAAFPGMYSCFTPAVMLTFGPEHYYSNYGLLFTMNIGYSLLFLLVTQTLFDVIGYTGLLFFVGTCSVISAAAIYTFPEGKTSESYRSRFSDDIGV